MAKLLLTCLFYFTTAQSLDADYALKSQDAVTFVYICDSSSAKKYHYTKTCRGLNACKHDIEKVTLTDAKQKYNRTLCGWED